MCSKLVALSVGARIFWQVVNEGLQKKSELNVIHVIHLHLLTTDGSIGHVASRDDLRLSGHAVVNSRNQGSHGHTEAQGARPKRKDLEQGAWRMGTRRTFSNKDGSEGNLRLYSKG